MDDVRLSNCSVRSGATRARGRGSAWPCVLGAVLSVAFAAGSCKRSKSGAKPAEEKAEPAAEKDSTGDKEALFASARTAPVAPPDKVDLVIVAGDALAASAQRYRSFREAAGHKAALALVADLASAPGATGDLPAHIEAFIARHFAARDPSRPFYALLLGDADTPVPAGSYREDFDGSIVTSDNVYADVDGDHVPDLAIGRIPVTTDAELDLVREKIARYESTYTVGEFNRRINIIAVPGGFGAFIDSLIESLAYQLLDAWSYKYDITFTYASSNSPVFYPPASFSDRVFELLNGGSLFSVYVGHGNVDSLDEVVWGNHYYPVLDTSRLAEKLHMRNKPPVLLLFTCLTGAFDQGDSLAERLLRLPGGPPAVVASTEISHPYPNAVLLKDLGWLIAKHREATIGELFRQAKLRLVENRGYCRELIDKYGSLVVEDAEIEAQKRTHLHMYTLIGDPTMKMAYVAGRSWLELSAGKVARGGAVAVEAEFRNLREGTAHFTVQSRREVIAGAIAKVPPGGDEVEWAPVIRANYAAANNKVVAAADAPIIAGKARAEMTVPEQVPPGTYFVKVYAEDGVADAFGHVSFTVTE